MAERLAWLLNGCYLWKGEVDSANNAHSCFVSLSFFLPFFLVFFTPSPALLVVMAVMTEKTVRRHREREIAETGTTFGKGAVGKKGSVRCKMPQNGGVKKKECGKSSGAFIKTIIVQDLRIPPGAGVHVEAHIIN